MIKRISPLYEQAWNTIRITGDKTKFNNQKDKAIKSYEEFLSLRIDNPSKADICMQQCFRHSELIVNKRVALENISNLETLPHLAYLKRLGDDKMKKLYSNSLHLRKKLIKSNRFLMNAVTPKMGIVSKVLFKIF